MDALGLDPKLLMEGRAGPDVVVGDSKENSPMGKTVLSRKAVLAQGAVMACLAPKLAADAKIDITPAFAGVTAKNYVAKKSTILAEITKRVSGKLAQDADLENLPGVLDSLDAMSPEEPALLLADPAKDADPADPLAEIKAQIAALTEAVARMQKAEKSEAQVTLGGDEDPEAEEEETVDKPAMDAAIAAAVKATEERAKAVREAEKAIRPYVGELAVAQDSADGVYRAALEMLGVDVTGVHPSAYPVVLKHQPKPGAARKPVVAQDAAVAKGFAERYPSLAPVRII